MKNPETGNNMEEFYGDVRRLVEETPGHFLEDEFDSKELTGSDRAIWEEVKDGSLTREELEEYDREVKESKNISRLAFLGVVNNKAVEIFLERDIERREKEKEKK